MADSESSSEGAFEKAYSEAVEKADAGRPKAAASEAKPAEPDKAPADQPVAVARKPKSVAAPAISGPGADSAGVQGATAKPRKPAVHVARKAKANKQKKPTSVTFKVSRIKERNTMEHKAKQVEQGLKSILTEAQGKARAAYEKSNSAVGELGEIARGNIEAVSSSGKILGRGLKQIGESYVADARGALETLSGDVKELAAVKSPGDLFKLQGKVLGRNIDGALALTSKNAQALRKLAGEVFAPLSARTKANIETIREAV
jgi:hypothetical protein